MSGATPSGHRGPPGHGRDQERGPEARKSTLPIASEADVASAMRAGRMLAEEVGLSLVEAQHVATAVSEVATNVWRYAGSGEMELEAVESEGRRGVRIVVSDRGPGIADVPAALRDGVSSGGSLGVGLPGARRLMDEFELRSAAGQGTVVVMEKWAGGREREVARWTLVVAEGAVPFAQRVRNGVLFGVAAGAHAEQAAAVCTAQAWRPPTDLVAACHGLHPPRRALALGLASLSGLDGALTWLRTGPIDAALVRLRHDGQTTFRPPRRAALEGDAALGLAAQTLGARRDDVLVLAAGHLDERELVELAHTAPHLPEPLRQWPALCLARIDHGALEPRRRPSTLN
jgi:serine/threonine-protein kinase RsbT